MGRARRRDVQSTRAKLCRPGTPGRIRRGARRGDVAVISSLRHRRGGRRGGPLKRASALHAPFVTAPGIARRQLAGGACERRTPETLCG
ncbi:hypothetical protein EVAR_50414_1 [Eumeta japonica]|uniref:Uncharacterized protein n=1 Tax=Eumeta variegata TaxID=151549 RepID=A0A4C1WVQ7_EUMVA|nr:hypothetical protein EVAR_50414_1 [Eumeta japonica]